MSLPPASADRIRRLNEDDCAAWAYHPTVHPFTGRAININGATYNAIAKRCREAFRIYPANSAGSDGPNRPAANGPLPRQLGIVDVPQTSGAWKGSSTRKYIQRLNEACFTYGFISELYAEMAPDFFQAIQLLTEHDILPDSEKAEFAKIAADLKAFIAEPNNVRRTERKNLYDSHEAEMDLAIMQMLRDQPTDVNLAQIREYLQVYDFNMYVRSGNAGYSNSSVDMLVAVEALQHDILLMRAAPGNDGAAYALPESRERSLPESVSQRRAKTKKPRRAAADATAPDEYYPWSATEDVAPTDRSRFRSHAKMSAVSAGPQPSPGASPLPPLSPKKRTALLAELREACTVMKDMISMQRFDRMNKKALQLVVRLGAKRGAAASGNESCYYVKNIYQLWATAAKSNSALKDPLTRVPVTREEQDDIMRKVRYLRPNAADPRDHAIRRDKKLALVVEQVYADHAGGRVGFYNLLLKRPVGEKSYVVSNLGYLPSDIEPADVGGDANLTSAAVIGNIQALFDSGLLMQSNVVPYRCCSVHIVHKMSYWLQKTSNSPAPHHINMRRWKRMATEVYGAL
jgi:hypothetical protein